MFLSFCLSVCSFIIFLYFYIYCFCANKLQCKTSMCGVYLCVWRRAAQFGVGRRLLAEQRMRSGSEDRCWTWRGSLSTNRQQLWLRRSVYTGVGDCLVVYWRRPYVLYTKRAVQRLNCRGGWTTQFLALAPNSCPRVTPPPRGGGKFYPPRRHSSSILCASSWRLKW